MPLLGFIAFLWILGVALIWPVLPFQALGFGASPLQVTLLFATDTAVAMLAAPLVGRLSDRLGRRPVITAGLILGGIGFLYLAVADSLADLYLSRVLGGLSLAALPALQAALSDITSHERRIFGFSFYNGAYALAFVVGPLATWQALSLFEATPAWIALLAGAVSLGACGLLRLPAFAPPEPAQSRAALAAAPEPHAGAAASAPGQAPDPGLSGLAIAAFLVPLSAIVMLGIAHAGWDAILAVWSDQELRWGESEVAIGYAVAGGCAAATQFLLAPRLCRRLGEAQAALVATLLAGAALIGLGASNGGWGSFLALGLLGTAVAAANSCLYTLLTHAVPAHRQGGALGLAGGALSLAWLIGPLVAGLAFSRSAPGLPFLIGAAACLLAAGTLAACPATRAARAKIALSEW